MTAIALVSIAVTPANPSVATGSTQQFTATGTYNDNSTQNITGSVTWSSGTTADATINSAGVATALSQGTSTITATSGAIHGAATLTVSSGSPCDVNGVGSVTVGDVQEMINEALGANQALHDLDNSGTVRVVDVMLVINAALGSACDAK